METKVEKKEVKEKPKHGRVKVKVIWKGGGYVKKGKRTGCQKSQQQSYK